MSLHLQQQGRCRHRLSGDLNLTWAGGSIVENDQVREVRD